MFKDKVGVSSSSPINVLIIESCRWVVCSRLSIGVKGS